MYLGQVFLRNNPSLKWEQPLGDRRIIDFGKPVRAGFDRDKLNPVDIVITLAYEIADERKLGTGLRKIDDI